MSLRVDVLAALRQAGERGVSGELLARELGVSRVAIGKHVKALRADGYQIDAEPGSGYVLRSAPDGPIPAEIAVRLQSTLWSRLEGGGETGSTNDDARALARSGAFEGTVVLASVQTAGRGRLGREWVSPAGGAYFSAVLRPDVAPFDVSALSLVVALGIARGLERVGVVARLKWPNDVLLGDRKLAGVLLEMAAEADAVEWVVAGVGLNVKRPDGPATHARAAYLSDCVEGLGVAMAVATVLDGIAETYGEWAATGFAALRGEFDARSSVVGQEVTVSDRDGGVRASGMVCGVDDDGRLLVAGESGVSAVSAGEVTLRVPRQG